MMKIGGVKGLEKYSRKPRVVDPVIVAKNRYNRKVRQDMVTIALAKLQRGPDGKFKQEFNPDEIDQIGEQLLVWFMSPDVHKDKNGDDVETQKIWLKDFAPYFGVSWNRIQDFAKRSTHFAECLAIAKDVQEARLVKLGAFDRNASLMSIFALKNNSGYSDKREIGHTGTVHHSVETKSESTLDAELDELLAGTSIGREGSSRGKKIAGANIEVTAGTTSTRNRDN